MRFYYQFGDIVLNSLLYPNAIDLHRLPLQHGQAKVTDDPTFTLWRVETDRSIASNENREIKYFRTIISRRTVFLPRQKTWLTLASMKPP